jgi:hypothetical protein
MLISGGSVGQTSGRHLGAGGNAANDLRRRGVRRFGSLLDVLLGDVTVVTVPFVRFAAPTSEAHFNCSLQRCAGFAVPYWTDLVR